jgi:rhamnosyltransferase
MEIPGSSASAPPNSPRVQVETLAVITVTYHPNLDLLKSQLESLPAAALKIIVDNASPVALRDAVRELCAAGTRCLFIANETNRGLPAAINQGVRRAREALQDCRYLLFLDQDTEPGENGIFGLLQWYEKLNAAGADPGCIGPRMVDADTGLDHGFHLIAGWRWVRRYPSPDSAPVECANLNCSGTLLRAELFVRLGGLDEDFFLDHLDTEWAFRVQAAGYKLFGIPAISFRHRMGQKTWRIWLGGWRVWPYRMPQRHYLLFRNSIWLMRRDYVPAVWKIWAALKLMLTMTVHALMDRRRFSQLQSMVRGIVAGMRNRRPSER